MPKSPLARLRRGATVALAPIVVAVLAVPGGSPALAQTSTPTSTTQTASTDTTASVRLPSGWTLNTTTRSLVWRPTTPLRRRDARVVVSLEGQPLQTTTLPDGTQVVAHLSAAQLARLQRATSPQSGTDTSPLAVMASGRRLDSGSDGKVKPAGTRTKTKTKTSKRTSTSTTSAPPVIAPDRVLTGADDPGKPGSLATRTGEYDLTPVQLSGIAQPVEMRAVVVSPAASAVSGRAPVALFLHGRHEACYVTSSKSSGDRGGSWPCPTGWSPVPSHRGYLAYQQNLASQGWVTISVAANGINAQDDTLDDGGAEARAALLRAHLSTWAEWTASDTAWAGAPDIVRSGPRPDLGRVLLIGHSRGGEGANRFAIDSAIPADGVAVPWRIRGIVHLAPTAFGRNPAPGVPVVVVLPACDGDVSDLQGQSYLDDARDAGADPALRTALLVAGANHNFFNTEWTPGRATAPSDDDADSGSSACSPGRSTRISATAQEQVGVTYTAAAARALVLGDTVATTLVDGSSTGASSTAGIGISSQSLGGGRTPLLVPDSSRSGSGTLSAVACRMSTTDETDESPCRKHTDTEIAPSFWPASVRTQPTRWALRLGWSSEGAVTDLPVTSTSLAGASAVAVRLVAPAGSSAAPLQASLVDAAGRTLSLGSTSVTGLPKISPQKSWMPEKDVTQEVRLPLDRQAATAGFDLAQVRTLRLKANSSGGRLWLLDAWGVPASASVGSQGTTAFVLPRVDVQPLRVAEGDTTHSAYATLTVRGTLTSSASVWLLRSDLDYETVPIGPITLPAGTTSTTVAVSVPGDTVDDIDERDVGLVASAVKGVVVADYAGRATIVDDDASPIVRVSTAATATEKGYLTWEFSLSEPSDAPLVLPVTAVAVANGRTELNVADLDSKWLKRSGFDPRRTGTLSSNGLAMTVEFAPGTTSAELSIRTASDSLVEGTEEAAFSVGGDTPGARPAADGTWVRGLSDGAILTGTVLDATS